MAINTAKYSGRNRNIGRTLAIGLFVSLLTLNLFFWWSNRGRLSPQARPVLRTKSKLYEVARSNKNFHNEFGCFYLLADRIGGASLALHSDFRDYGWHFGKIAQLKVSPATAPRELELSAWLAALNQSPAPMETSRCAQRDLLLMTMPGATRYVMASTADGDFLILPRSVYQSSISNTHSTDSCDLISQANWLPREPEQAELEWDGDDLRIQVDTRVDKLYLKTGGGADFQAAPATVPCPVEGGSSLAITSDVKVSKSLGMSFWLIEYGAKGRLTHTSFRPAEDSERFIKLQPETTSVRYAIRVWGAGEATIREFNVITAD